MRVCLAVLIIFDHSILIVGDRSLEQLFIRGELRALHDCLVPMYFGLSGFLVAGSLYRTKTLLTFIGLRLLRIFPALAVDTLFAAFVLGPFLTDLPLHDYFGHAELRSYLLNMVGDIHYELPGVFDKIPLHQVNSQLWTMPFELFCYVMLTACAVAGLHRRRPLLLAAIVSAQFVIPALYLAVGRHLSFHTLLVTSFLAGIAFYALRDRIPFSGRLFVASCVVTLALLSFKPIMWLAPFPLLYVTVYLGFLNPRKSLLISTGDYSYALYLYAFPLQQAAFQLCPLARTWYGNLALGLVLTFIAAIMSWHLVEKHALGLRKKLFAFESRLLEPRRPGPTSSLIACLKHTKG